MSSTLGISDTLPEVVDKRANSNTKRNENENRNWNTDKIQMFWGYAITSNTMNAENPKNSL